MSFCEDRAVKRTSFVLAATVPLLFLAGQPAHATSETDATRSAVIQQDAGPTALTEAFDHYMQAAVRNAAFSGTVLVARDGAPVFRRSYGLANRAFEIPNRDDTLYQLASITKPFTALLVMMLQEEGKLNIDDKACAYLVDCPPAWQAITVRQLLTHTSGVPNYSSLPDWDETLDSRTYGDGGLAALVRDRPLEFAPGAGFRYSNSGYNLLGSIIERVTGLPFATVMRDRILRPSGMDHTVFNASRRIVPQLATGYYSIGSTFIEATPQSMTGVSGEAGLSSTVDDLLAWTRALDADRLISASSAAQMIDQTRNNYGLGWEIRTWHDHRMIGHAGSGPGYSNMLARFPDQGLTVIVLSNSDEASAGGTARALAGIAFGHSPALPVIQPKARILDAILAEGVDAGLKLYTDMKTAQPGVEAFSTDELLVEIGYDLQGLPAMAEARRIFNFALQQYPQSAYSHDGLADVAAAEGDIVGAVSHFEKSLQIDPDNHYAADGLQRLKARDAP